MEQRFLLKLKHFNNAIQYTYSPCFTSSDSSFRSSSSSDSSSESSSESERCSISRSISLIKDYCLSNTFDFFFTLTLKTKKRSNVLFSSSLIINSIKKYARKRKDFKYIYVFEKQKKGGIHIHGFFSGFDDLYINEHGHLSSKFFDKLGFQCFDRVEKVNPFYLIKYISKSPIKELKHRFYRSQNLNKPYVEYLHCNFNEFKNFHFTFKNKYCKMVTIEN